MYILGINSFHGDSSAALLKDGNLIVAAEEERFNRIKHYSGFPVESIRYCLKDANISISEISHIAVNTNPSSHKWQKIIYTLMNRVSIKLLVNKIQTKAKRVSVYDNFAHYFPDNKLDAKIHKVEHHKAHLYSSHSESGFERSVSVSIDGFGDFSSCAWGMANGNTCDIEQQIFFPHSLGIFYQALTQFLGFPNYGDEYKVMGLAPYGKPSFLSKLRKIVKTDGKGIYTLNLKYFRHHKDKVEVVSKAGIPQYENLFSDHMCELLGIPERKANDPLLQIHKDLAHSIQARYEEILFELLNNLYEKYQCENLSLSGGCAMNSVANGKIRKQTPFKKVFIPAAAGDAGGAIGSAYYISKIFGTDFKKAKVEHAYWGPKFGEKYVQKILVENSLKLPKNKFLQTNYKNEEKLCHDVAKGISQGLVVGWFQGRMEWGPRALGNRSILGDPRRADMKDILNIKIKRRESFRPFAPSILREKVNNWFDEDDDVPFMMKVFKIHEEKRKFIPAVAHVDGSGRLQTVSDLNNSRYYKLIKAFDKITGVPIVLNTSFNENEPIVCNPEQALDCFLRTKMDVLVLGETLIRRI